MLYLLLLEVRLRYFFSSVVLLFGSFRCSFFEPTHNNSKNAYLLIPFTVTRGQYCFASIYSRFYSDYCHYYFEWFDLSGYSSVPSPSKALSLLLSLTPFFIQCIFILWCGDISKADYYLRKREREREIVLELKNKTKLKHVSAHTIYIYIYVNSYTRAAHIASATYMWMRMGSKR